MSDVGMPWCRFDKQVVAGPSEAWEAEVRDLLQDHGLKNHVEGFAVPLDEQAATLAGHIQRIVDRKVGSTPKELDDNFQLESRLSCGTAAV